MRRPTSPRLRNGRFRPIRPIGHLAQLHRNLTLCASTGSSDGVAHSSQDQRIRRTTTQRPASIGPHNASPRAQAAPLCHVVRRAVPRGVRGDPCGRRRVRCAFSVAPTHPQDHHGTYCIGRTARRIRPRAILPSVQGPVPPCIRRVFKHISPLCSCQVGQVGQVVGKGGGLRTFTGIRPSLGTDVTAVSGWSGWSGSQQGGGLADFHWDPVKFGIRSSLGSDVTAVSGWSGWSGSQQGGGPADFHWDPSLGSGQVWDRAKPPCQVGQVGQVPSRGVGLRTFTGIQVWDPAKPPEKSGWTSSPRSTGADLRWLATHAHG